MRPVKFQQMKDCPVACTLPLAPPHFIFTDYYLGEPFPFVTYLKGRIPHLGNSKNGLAEVKSLIGFRQPHPFTGRGYMIQTEQLSPDTIIYHVQGLFHQNTAKELALSVFRSQRFGFKTFLFDLSQVSLMDDQASRHLANIGQGLENKGKTWRILSQPPSLENQYLLSPKLDNFPQESWN